MCGSSASCAYGRAGSVNGMFSPRGSLRKCVGFRIGARMPPPADDPRQKRDEDHQQDHDLDVLVDARNVASQEIPDEEHVPDPAHSADDVVLHVSAVLHLPNSSHDWHKGANDRHESSEDDGEAAVFLIERMSAIEMLLVEEEGILASEQPGPGGDTYGVPNRIAENRCDRQQKAE